MFCSNCGTNLPDDTKFCQYCGTAQKREESPQQNFYSPQQQVVNNNTISAQTATPPKITFVWVSSLVFMIILAIKTISGLGTLSDLKQIDQSGIDLIQQFHDWGMISIVLVAICFVLMLILFSLVNSIRSKKSLSSSGAFAVSVIVLIASAIFLFADLKIFAITQNISNQTGIVITDTEQSQMTGAILFDVTFVVFCVINIIKIKVYSNKLDSYFVKSM